MPYFSNKVGDEGVEQSCRDGGENLAVGLAKIYEMVAHLEQKRPEPASESLEFARSAILEAVRSYSESAQMARGEPVNLERGTVAERDWLEEPLAWLERRGVAPEAITDAILFQVTIDSQRALFETLMRFEPADRAPNFQVVNALIRMAIDVQLLTLGVTAMFEISRRAS